MRMFECSLDGNRSGLVFAEDKTQLLLTCFFRDKSASSLVEGIEWLRTSVRKTTLTDVLELHGDSVTSWAVPGRGCHLNTAVVEDYVNSGETAYSHHPVSARHPEH